MLTLSYNVKMVNTFDVSASMQDYLEVILELCKTEEKVRVTDIAKKLNVKKASVNGTVKKLTDLGLVTHKVYGPVNLTENGRKIAKEIEKRHKKLERFLTDVLEVDPETADQDACRIEHVASSQTMQKLTEFLTNYENKTRRSD